MAFPFEFTRYHTHLRLNRLLLGPQLRTTLASAVGNSASGRGGIPGTSVLSPVLRAGAGVSGLWVPSPLIGSVAAARRRGERHDNSDKRSCYVAVAAATARGGGGGGGAVAVAEPVTGRVEDTELYDEAYNSYLSYAMSVIVSRAIPDVRDGLKPVHRRILYAMHELGLVHNKPFKKCARVVGEVLGKFHPHGDTAVYDSLVRMAQPFAMRQTLVDGHGNFGSLDNDPAAAMRYTECRLTRAAGEALLADIGPDTVDWQPTFDESQVGLASNIPPHNLGEVVSALRALITDPRVTTEELLKHVRGPDFPTGGEVVVGPELLQVYETGRGSVVVRGKATIERVGGGSGGGGGGDDGGGNDEVATAAGRTRRRRGAAAAAAAAQAVDEDIGGGRGGSGRELVVITELPYQVYKSDLVASIAELIESKQLEGASDVRDESDRTGVRVVVEVKKGYSGKVVLAQLYNSTRLQVNFHYNCTSLLNTKPLQMGLKDMLLAFLDFRCDVVQRRSSASLRAAQQRLHLVEGFLRLLREEGRLDAVVADVRAAEDGGAARRALVAKHGLSEEQAEAILGLTLRRLTGLEAAKLDQERRELQQSIARLGDILANRTTLLAVVEQEAEALAAAFPEPRRTALVAAEDVPATPSLESLVPPKPCLVLASRRGFLRRLAGDSLTAQNRNTRGKSGIRLRSGDQLASLVAGSDRDLLMVVTPDGRMFKTRTAAVPPSSSSASSASPTAAAASGGTESVGRMKEVEDAGSEAKEEEEVEGEDVGGAVAGPCLVLCTRGGRIKRLALKNRRESKKGIMVMGLESSSSKATGDGRDSSSSSSARDAASKKKGPDEAGEEELCWAALSRSPGDVVVVASAEGQVLLFPATDVRVSGPQSAGTHAMRMSKRRPNDRIADITVLPAELAPLLGSQLPTTASASAGTATAASERGEDVAEDGDDDGEEEEEEGGEQGLTAAIDEEQEGEQEEGEEETSSRGPAGPCLLLVTAHGIGKRIPLGQLRLGMRRQAGMVAIRVASAERARQRSRRSSSGGTAAQWQQQEQQQQGAAGPDHVVAVLVVRDGEEVIMASRNGVVVRQSVDGIAVQGRMTRGTFVMQLDGGDEVVDVVAAAPEVPPPRPPRAAAAAAAAATATAAHAAPSGGGTVGKGRGRGRRVAIT
ncbi:hypothetical protein VOLCADRAFT_91671 [Volvox carteri f. nagariensis]|uniref:DNA topoisomerase (ATP-hydrolyzing) n=1 Tax=Volvox carteri f. nagariensis TaxID=3068 RepID=D8TXP4_VOLCA|nr:uncharacterized protein VOLCADRAFT_91671 [Volvox carteri f. nagariensis]EFJ47676.1 hypothetical protein VOLCADRAFT_91671 [Volvox carteri f. nagariensis]|eukprot:XP_002951147.1 hypothetical protein VOLCADRAFT_91671 [Volvox carteri f. nagariensis]